MKAYKGMELHLPQDSGELPLPQETRELHLPREKLVPLWRVALTDV